jgi:hypothetical protein
LEGEKVKNYQLPPEFLLAKLLASFGLAFALAVRIAKLSAETAGIVSQAAVKNLGGARNE